MNHTSKLPNVKTTIFTIMSQLAKQHNAVNLSQGFPNFPIDAHLVDLVNQSLKKDYNQYAPMLGTVTLREAISHKINQLYQAEYNPENEIVITSGATQAIFTVISAFVRPNDEVIMFMPAYDCYQPAIELQGGKIVPIQLHYPDYSVDWKEVKTKITSNTKMIIINTPQNPCGTIFSDSDLKQLEAITKDTDIIVLSDEVYEHMVYDHQKHESICKYPELKKRSFISASFGKTFHATGWKVGYCCGPRDLMEEFIKVHQFNVYSVNHPVQIALVTYLKDDKNCLYLHELFQQKRDLFLDAISNSKFQFTPTQATYFQLLSYKNISNENDVDFAKHLTKEHKIASIPLSVFNDKQLDEKVLRFCFAKTDETLLKAAEILNRI